MMMWRQSLAIAKKEFITFFASPAAYLFLGAFLAASFFILFWVEAFFARNTADLRSYFQWMPLLMIFLVSALTMRLWSEERRSGTLEFLATQPLTPFALVMGKFLASISLVGLALLLTIPLPVTVSMLGDLDWGPVLGGYLATFFVSIAYIGIGLTISFLTENQIISLILSVLVCLALYLLGSTFVTSLFSSDIAELLKQVGTSSRFSSVARGVLDLADIYYYLSIGIAFVVLNCYLLESRRWAQPGHIVKHRRWRMTVFLLVVNVILSNFSLASFKPVRMDLTSQQRYTISTATLHYLKHLKEPLLLRGYFSAKTHPLLEPLVPQLRDLMNEYAVYGGVNVLVEFVDPAIDPELEREALEDYGIKPVPLQIIDKYNPSVVNLYFNIVLRYGDQVEVLGFRDLIETKSQSESDLEVSIRNPEYEMTRAIKKIVSEYQSRGDLYTYIEKPIEFKGYISPDDALPPALLNYKHQILSVLESTSQKAGGKFNYTVVDPAGNGAEVAGQIAKQYGFLPMRASLESKQGFYFYLLLEDGRKAIQLPIPENADSSQTADFREILDSAVKRFSVGFVKKIGLYVPPAVEQNPLLRQYRMPSGRSFQQLRQRLTTNYDVELVEFDNGHVIDDVDMLLILAPGQLTATQVFAIDQFLMRGGTVIIASGAAEAKFSRSGVTAMPYSSGLSDWLAHLGITIHKTLVLDPMNAIVPLPVTRRVGNTPVREIKMINYPYAIDIRKQTMNAEHVITASFNQIPMIWASPIGIDVNQDRITVSELLRSSDQSWSSSSMQVLPDYEQYTEFGFPVEEPQQSYVLGMAMEGEFESYFKGKAHPLTASEKQQPDTAKLTTESIIEQSLPSARLVVYSSNDFLTDKALRLLAGANGTMSQNAIDLIENTVDWSVEDSALLSIRNRGYYARTLIPLSQSKQQFWEYLNYALAAGGLLIVFLIHFVYQKIKARSQCLLIAEVTNEQ